MKDLADVKWTCPVCGKENTFHVHAHDVRLIPQTNADRIRAMPDEELADKISSMIKMDCLNCVVLQNDCIAWENSTVDCKAAWLNWLKQEAE